MEIMDLEIMDFLIRNCCSSAVSRKVLREVASGGRDAERVKLKLEIVVEVIYHLSISGVSFY